MRKREDIEKDYLEGKNKKDLTFEVLLDIRDVLVDFFVEFIEDRYEDELCDDPNCTHCRELEKNMYPPEEKDIVIEELSEELIEQLCHDNGVDELWKENRMSKITTKEIIEKESGFKPFKLIIDIEKEEEFQALVGMINTTYERIEQMRDQTIDYIHRTDIIYRLNDEIYDVISDKMREFKYRPWKRKHLQSN